MSRKRRPRKPLQPVELEIEDLTHDGNGVSHIDGKAIFVSGALPGEKVIAKINSSRSRFFKAQTLEVIHSSENRVEAKCPHFSICGGCSLQHMNHESQIEFKNNLLFQQLQHFGNVETQKKLPPLQSNIWNYRRKARLGVKLVEKKGGILVGFREKHSHYIADIKTCTVLNSSVEELLLPLRVMIGDLHAKARIPQIEIAVGDDSIALVFRHLDPLLEEDITRLIEFSRIHKIQLYLQPKGPDTVHKIWPESGNDRLYYSLPDFDLRLAFHPMDFTQVNAEINRKMTKLAIELLELDKDDRVLDLFCGLGNFSLPIATKAQQVIAVEGNHAMVERGYENAQANNLDNINFFAADLCIDFSKKTWAEGRFDKILIDPPRSGAKEICEFIDRFDAKKIVYVSCNPATLSRDAGILVSKGYQLQKAGIIDMFPHTGHVESIAVFEK